MDRYICIHGHFYRPPRENPWLEAIELQDSAYPNHDWNQRIPAECSTPNSASRILDAGGRIRQITNNSSKISFHSGLALPAWVEQKRPVVYRAILPADEESRRRLSGHGSAMSQACNHMILRLANTGDKRTRVLWGIRDFEHRFRRGLERFGKAVGLYPLLPFQVNLRAAQNSYHAVRRFRFPEFQARAGGGDSAAREWTQSRDTPGAKPGFGFEPQAAEGAR